MITNHLYHVMLKRGEMVGIYHKRTGRKRKYPGFQAVNGEGCLWFYVLACDWGKDEYESLPIADVISLEGIEVSDLPLYMWMPHKSDFFAQTLKKGWLPTCIQMRCLIEKETSSKWFYENAGPFPESKEDRKKHPAIKGREWV